MATESCGSLTFSGYRFYNGGWSSPTYNTSFSASYSKTNSYVTVDKITLPSFTNAKFVAPYTLNLSIPVISNHSSNTIYVYLCSADPGSTSIYATTPKPTQAPSSYIGSGSKTVTYNNSSSHATSITVTCDSTDLSSGGTYYLWIQSTNLTQIHYGSKPSGTLTGTLATFAVKYNANGHGTAPSSQTKTYGTALTLRSFISNATGTGYKVTFNANNGSSTPSAVTSTLTYKQTYWNTNSSGTGTNYGSGGSYTSNAAATLYAIWSTTNGAVTLASAITRANAAATGYKVTFNANGGTCTTSDLTAARTTKYTFGGWNTNSSGTGTNYSAGASYTPTAAITLYAKWSSSTTTTAITLPTPTRTGYTFAGWYTAASGGTLAGAAGASYKPSSAITLYAQWTINSYQYTLGSDTGVDTTGSTASGKKNYGTTITLKASTSAGYTWSKWSSSNTSLVADKTTANTTFTMPAGAVTMTPVANPNTYYIAYNGNGHTGGSMSQTTCTYDVAKALTTNSYVRLGYEFTGWNTKADGTGISYGNGQSVSKLTTTAGGTVTLYAQWEPLSQMFIWHNGKWYRALKYVYNTTS